MTAAKCRCSHLASLHHVDEKGRAICRAVVCGCVAFRPQQPPVMPDRDPNPYPRRNTDMGPAHVDDWPERWELND